MIKIWRVILNLTELTGVQGHQETLIKGITADSREVRPGYLFAALSGSKTDGVHYIGDALQHGAVAILASQKMSVGHDNKKNVTFITDENPRKKYAQIAASYYGLQPETIAAVTGTSGKTSTVHFCQQLWSLSGVDKCAFLGTLGVHNAQGIRYGSLTTPDAQKLHAELADLSASGISHLAMEASSHGLDQYRLDGVNVSVAAYTNLSRDHLDYHASMEEYFAVKSRLFSEVLKQGGLAVINADDSYADALIEVCEKTNKSVFTYGRKGQDLQVLDITPAPKGQVIDFIYQGEEHRVTLALVGEFQAMNALCALAITGSHPKALEGLQGVPGRLQLVQKEHPKGAAVYIDYAHKPGALEVVLNTMRHHTGEKLVCVFGCGGDRDVGKRSMMGKIASQLCDNVVVTDDNPRTEDPGFIRKQVLEGTKEGSAVVKEIGDRAEAIMWAVQNLKKNDVLVIAGKGHEQGQIAGDHVHPFDDYTEAEKAIEECKL